MAPLLLERRQSCDDSTPLGTTNISNSYYDTLIHTIIALSIVSAFLFFTTLALFRFWHSKSFALIDNKQANPRNKAAKRVETHHFILDGGNSAKKKRKAASKSSSSRSRESPKAQQQQQQPPLTRPVGLPATPPPAAQGPVPAGWNNDRRVFYATPNFGEQPLTRPRRGPVPDRGRVEELDEEIDEGVEEAEPTSYQRVRPRDSGRQRRSGRRPIRGPAFDAGQDNVREEEEPEVQADASWGGDDGLVGPDEDQEVNEERRVDDVGPEDDGDAGREDSPSRYPLPPSPFPPPASRTSQASPQVRSQPLSPIDPRTIPLPSSNSQSQRGYSPIRLPSIEVVPRSWPPSSYNSPRILAAGLGSRPGSRRGRGERESASRSGSRRKGNRGRNGAGGEEPGPLSRSGSGSGTGREWEGESGEISGERWPQGNEGTGAPAEW